MLYSFASLVFYGGSFLGVYWVLLVSGRRVAPNVPELSGQAIRQAVLLGSLAALLSVWPERHFVRILVGVLESFLVWINFEGSLGGHYVVAAVARPLVIALFEEGSKLLLLLYLYRKCELPRLFCLAGLSLGLGFAAVENLWYVASYGLSSIYWRLPSSNIVHLSLGAVVALKILRQRRRLALVSATLWHGSYNLVLQQGKGLWAAVILLLLSLYTGWGLWRGLTATPEK